MRTRKLKDNLQNLFFKGETGRRRLWIAAAFVNLVVIALVTVMYFQKTSHLISYCFDSQQISSYTNEEKSSFFGGKINEEYEAGLYDAIPETDMFLPKGFYEYTVHYISDSEGSMIWPHTYINYYDIIQQSPVYFMNGEHVGSENFWLNADINVALRLSYSGSGSVEILDFEIKETGAQARIDLFFRMTGLFILDLAAFIIAYQKRYGISDQAKYTFACLAVICIFASFPLLVDYAVTGHDFEHHMIRIEGVKEGLLCGQFPVRISPVFHNGYGYAIPIFYGELLLYLPALFRLIGFKLTTCYNIYVLFLNVLTCFGGYYCFKSVLKRNSTAVIVTLLYTLAPYRLMCLYLRSAMGEVSGMVFLPFVICGLYRIYTEDVHSKEYKFCFLPLVAGLTGIINSHVLTGEITACAVLITCVILFFRTFQKERFWALCKAALWTLGVNLWYLVPFADFALTQKIEVFQNGKIDHIQNTGVFLAQLVSLFQKFTDSGSKSAGDGMLGEMPLTLGMSFVLGMILCAAMIWVGGNRRELKKNAFFVLLLTAVLSWMATVYFPWDRVATMSPLLERLISTLQFTWRFLGIASAGAAFTTGLGLILLEQKEGKWASLAAGILLCTLTSVSAMYFMQDCMETKEPIVLNDSSHSDTVRAAMKDEYMLVGSDWNMRMYDHEPKVYGGELSDYRKEGTNVSFSIKGNGENCYVLLPLLNYKGYSVSSKDGTITDKNMSTGEGQVLRINFPKDYSGEIRVRYKGFWYWRLSEAVSLVCILYLCGQYLYRRKKI